jgi:uncharacterized protein
MQLKSILFGLLLCIMTTQIIAQQQINVLVFTKTTDYYHNAVPNAMKAFYEIGHEKKWGLTFTEDSTMFTEAFLQKFDVVVFLLTGGDLLNQEQKLAFKKFIQNGGGFVGVHSATVTEYKWKWYGELVRAYFTGHPPVQKGKLIIENKNHPSTKHFNTDTLEWVDEWYSFDKNPRKEVDVLISIDEKSYDIKDNPWFKGVDLVMGDHPLVWCQEFDGGRSFQTALGHEPKIYDNQLMRQHIIGAIEWAAKKEK